MHFISELGITDLPSCLCRLMRNGHSRPAHTRETAAALAHVFPALPHLAAHAQALLSDPAKLRALMASNPALAAVISPLLQQQHR